MRVSRTALKEQEVNMKKNVLSLVLTASLICGMMPVEGLGQKASAAASGASDSIEVMADTADVSNGAKEGEETVVSGTFGGTTDSTGAVLTPDTHQWSLAKESGVLTISGEGDMPDYTSGENTPWYDYSDDIKKIVFTGDVTAVGAHAFHLQKNVVEVDFSAAEGLTAIHTYAFQGTSSLETLTGVENIETLDTGSFQASGFKSVSMPNVETVPKAAFRSCTNMTSVSFQNATLLGDEAFYSCTSLKEVNAPNVDTLDGQVFRYSSIESISLPNLTSIQGGYTFQNCSKLKEMSFPKLESIDGAGIFESCSSLEVIDFPTVTTTNTHLNNFTNDCPNLMWVNLPNLVAKTTSISFGNCYSLVYVDVSSVERPNNIGFGKDCTSLKRFYIKGTNVNQYYVEYFYKSLPTLPNKPELYILSANEKNFTNSASSAVIIQKIDDDDAFAAVKAKETDVRITQEDYNISSPVLPKVTGAATGAEITYQYYTDSKCQTPVDSTDATQKPTVPGQYYVRATAGAVENVAFETTSNIVPFKVFGEIKEDGYSYMYGQNKLIITDAKVMDTEYTSASNVPWNNLKNEILEVDIKEGVTLTKIAPYTFYNFSKLKYFDLPATVTSIGARAFYGCSAWGSDSDRPVKNVLTDKVTSIGEYAFYNCSAITGTMTFNNTITEIPTNVLYGCAGVSQIKYSANVTSFGQNCFSGTGITEISFPAGITEYSTAFFTGCKNITSITLPSELTTLPEYFFSDCAGLTEVTLPQGITALPNWFFSGCSSLTQFTIPETVTSIGTYCFRYSGLTSITLPDTVDTIGECAFSYCKALESAELSAKLTILPREVFASSGLKKMIVPATITTIGKQVFRDCSNLTYLEFQNDNYTADTFELYPQGNPPTDGTFNNLRADAMIVCDGNTYDFLSAIESGTSWNPKEMVRKRSVLLEELQTDYAVEKAEAAKLSEADYDAALWSDFQAALQAADELFVTGNETYEKIQNMIAARKSIATAAKAFLRDTYIKADAELKLESDYDTDGDGADAWYAFIDAIDGAMTVLQKEDVSLTDIINCDKKLKQASGAIVLLPTDTAKAECDKKIQEAEALKESDYTAESWAALQTALTEAKKLMETATRVSEVEAAEKMISDAMAALVKSDGNEPGTTPSAAPSNNPSTSPSASPSTSPSVSPSTSPSTSPSANPSAGPSTKPSTAPSTKPSVKPSTVPTTQPNTNVTVKKATIKKVKSTKKKTMLVQWKKLASVSGYQVQIALKKNFKKGKKTYTVKKAKTTKKTIKKLKRKKKYFVRIRAYKTVNGKKYYGKWSKVKSVKVK